MGGVNIIMARKRRKKRETCWPFTGISASEPSPKTDRFLLFLAVLWNAIVKLLNSENLEKTSPSVFFLSSREHPHSRKSRQAKMKKDDSP
jgi:hypothetical protein